MEAYSRGGSLCPSRLQCAIVDAVMEGGGGAAGPVRAPRRSDPKPVGDESLSLDDARLPRGGDAAADVERFEASTRKFYRQVLAPLALEEEKNRMLSDWSTASALSRSPAGVASSLKACFGGLPGIDVGECVEVSAELEARAADGPVALAIARQLVDSARAVLLRSGESGDLFTLGADERIVDLLRRLHGLNPTSESRVVGKERSLDDIIASYKIAASMHDGNGHLAKMCGLYRDLLRARGSENAAGEVERLLPSETQIGVEAAVCDALAAAVQKDVLASAYSICYQSDAGVVVQAQSRKFRFTAHSLFAAVDRGRAPARKTSAFAGQLAQSKEVDAARPPVEDYSPLALGSGGANAGAYIAFCRSEWKGTAAAVAREDSDPSRRFAATARLVAEKWGRLDDDERAPFEACRIDENFAKVAANAVIAEVIAYHQVRQASLPAARAAMAEPRRPDLLQVVPTDQRIAESLPMEPGATLVEHMDGLPDRVRDVDDKKRKPYERAERADEKALAEAQDEASYFRVSGSVASSPVMKAAATRGLHLPQVGPTPSPKRRKYVPLEEATRGLLDGPPAAADDDAA